MCLLNISHIITDKLRKKKLAEEERLKEQERLRKLKDEERKRKEGVRYYFLENTVGYICSIIPKISSILGLDLLNSCISYIKHFLCLICFNRFVILRII